MLKKPNTLNDLIFYILPLITFIIHVIIIPPYFGAGSSVGGDEPFHINKIIQYNKEDIWNKELIQELDTVEREKININKYLHQNFEGVPYIGEKPQLNEDLNFRYGRSYYAVADFLSYPFQNIRHKLYIVKIINLTIFLASIFFFIRSCKLLFKEKWKYPVYIFITWYSLYGFISTVNPDALVLLVATFSVYVYLKYRNNIIKRLLFLIPLIIFAFSIKQNLVLFLVLLVFSDLYTNIKNKLIKKITKLGMIVLPFLIPILLNIIFKLNLLPIQFEKTLYVNSSLQLLSIDKIIFFAKTFGEETFRTMLDKDQYFFTYIVYLVFFTIFITGIVKIFFKQKNEIIKTLLITNSLYLIFYIMIGYIFFCSTGNSTINVRHLIPIIPLFAIIFWESANNLFTKKKYGIFFISIFILFQLIMLIKYVTMYLIPRFLI